MIPSSDSIPQSLALRLFGALLPLKPTFPGISFIQHPTPQQYRPRTLVPNSQPSTNNGTNKVLFLTCSIQKLCHTQTYQPLKIDWHETTVHTRIQVCKHFTHAMELQNPLTTNCPQLRFFTKYRLQVPGSSHSSASSRSSKPSASLTSSYRTPFLTTHHLTSPHLIPISFNAEISGPKPN